MARWPDELSDCTVFLYRSVEDAEKGFDTGGSGFLLGLPWELNAKNRHIYAVTNYHVAISGGASIIRLNTKNGKSACIETDPSEWFHLDGHDLAVYRIDGWRHFGADSIFDYKYSDFREIELTDQIWSKYALGIGDDVVSIGRFIDLSGVQKNQPLLRTGVLANGEILSLGRGKEVNWDQEPSYIVEMRSRTGFSGSPVYIYIDPFTPRLCNAVISADLMELRITGPWLLGVHWGQLPIKGADAIETYLPGASASMLGVVPCSALTALLEDQRVVKERFEYEDRWRARGPEVVPKSSELPTKAENP